MFLTDWAAFDALIDWMGRGLFDLAWWQVLLITLGMTHITIASVTIYLHRHSAHRALDLHPIPAHFFRFWLWMTTGQVTKEWTAIHRKHHAKCEREGDPHSPVIFGIETVFWKGAELYRAEAKNQETLDRYGHNTPNDWIERNLYTRHSALGVSLMLIIDVALFGFLGLTVWAVQMAWIPFLAAGVINGIGHFWGYRNFKSPDTSTNILPWGILIGGEELHNNHHTFATSPKLSSKWYEFDIGWFYIRVLSMVGLAKPRALPAEMTIDPARDRIDADTVEAVISYKYELMASLAKAFKKDARRNPSAAVEKWAELRKEFEAMWSRRNVSVEQAVNGLQAWCAKAEASGIAALAEFSRRIRMAIPPRAIA